MRQMRLPLFFHRSLDPACGGRGGRSACLLSAVGAALFILGAHAARASDPVAVCVESDAAPLSVQSADVSAGGGLVFHTDGGDVFRLAGVVVESGSLPAPSLLAGANVSKPVAIDRYGRFVASVTLSNGQSLAARMIGDGTARYRHGEVSTACRGALLAAETAAREATLGLWAQDQNTIHGTDNPRALAAKVESYLILEGEIVSVGRTSRTIYLNFGSYWREDVTMTISRSAARKFERAGFALDAWDGATIRARGWVTEKDGPLMVLDGPEQVEFLRLTR